MARLGEIAELFGGEILGDKSANISGVSSLTSASEQHIAFYESESHYAKLSQCQAGAIIVSARHADVYKGNRWVVASPRLYFARVAQWLEKQHTSNGGIHPTAVASSDAIIAESASIGAMAVIEARANIGAGVVIGAGAVVGADCIIGERTALKANVVIYPKVRIGSDCVIHSGAVIGSDGFGFVVDENQHHIKIPQIGNVILENNIEVGSNSAIDRGALDNTHIGEGVKIDNLVQIGHNVQVGAHTIICGCTGIAGSVIIGKNCMIGANAGIVGHVTIGDGARVTARASVTRPVAAGETVCSMLPAKPIRQWRRFVGKLNQLANKKGNKYE